MVHVHFKEEIGVAELVPLVTTYIILFAYIYFSTRESVRTSRLLAPTPRLPTVTSGFSFLRCPRTPRRPLISQMCR